MPSQRQAITALGRYACMRVADTLAATMPNPSFALATRDTLHQGQAYAAYKLLGGDAKRTALVMRTTPDIIESLAHDFNWADSIEGDIGDADKLEAFKSVRRLESLLLGRQLHRIIGRIVQKVDDDPAFAERLCTKLGDDPDSPVINFDPKAIESLVKAAAAADEICFRALGDTTGSEGGKPRDPVGDALDLYQKMQNRFSKAPALGAVTSVAAVVKE